MSSGHKAISENEFMTSGVPYVFRDSMQDKILLALSKAKLKRKTPSSRDLFVLFRNLNTICGLNVAMEHPGAKR